MRKTLKPIQEFLRTESSSGIILIIATLLALFVANTGLNGVYESFFQTHFRVGVGEMNIDKPIILWINDGLMAIFFLLIGLEIKREMLYGELSSLRSAALPMAGAIGGALIPAMIFIWFNGGTAYEEGWAIAMATDIAFALGVLALLGSRIPLWAKVLLTATAVVDDLIAVAVIALFYTDQLNVFPLLVAAGALVVLIAMNRSGVHRLFPYLLVGLILWIAILKSGVHATVAGVLLGFTIPSARFLDFDLWMKKANEGVGLLNKSAESDDKELRETALEDLEDVVEYAQSPLHRLEHELHPWVAYFIMPVFAFANAGILLNAEMLEGAMVSTLSWGLIFSLVFGKQIGIFSSVALMHYLGISTLPRNSSTYYVIYGLACLSGIGFTMSLFITGLSYDDPDIIGLAKVGILAASLISGLLGYSILLFGTRKVVQ